MESAAHAAIRKQFPSLERRVNGKPVIYLDGPAGTQVPQSVIDAMVHYYMNSNSNTHGMFATTQETDAIIQGARTSVSALLNAESPSCISIGQNMTTLCYALAHGFSRVLKKGDEVLITQLDHEGNRGPWLTLRDSDVTVHEVKMKPEGVLDYSDLEARLNDRTRLVCVGMASNAIGTVNDFDRIRALTKKNNTWLLLDAVHYAPHFNIDVQASGCDFLLCSAYKFYGPHVGLLYCKPGLLEKVQTDRLRCQDQEAPFLIETGTLNHAAIAGVDATIQFIASLGKGNSLREKLGNAYAEISAHEHSLASRLYEGLKTIRGVTPVGQDFSSKRRAPTVSFTMEGKTPEQVCKHLGAANIFAWDGHFFAIRPIEVLGLFERGGVTRLGISVYNAETDVDAVLSEIKSIAALN